MSINGVDSSSGALVATSYDGDAVSTAIVQDVADGNFSGIKNIQSKEVYANISEATVADTLVTSSPIANGDNLVIVKNDDTIHEVVASGVTGVGQYSMDTTAITAGEIPSKVFTVDSKVAFNDGTGFIYPSELGNDYLAISGVAPAPDLTSGLVSHYILNNNADDIHGTLDGTPSGGVDFQGDVAKFDGVNDYIDTAQSHYREEVTYSVWFKANALVNSSSIFANVGTTTTGRLAQGLYISGTKILFDTYEPGGAGVASLTDISVGIWYHVVCTENAIDGKKIYINGVLDNSGIYESYSGGDIINTFRIGMQNSNYFNGEISNIRVYSEVKDQTFITALYEEGYYPKPLPLPTTDGLIAHYPLTGTAEDSTGNYDGTEVGNLAHINDVEFGAVASFDNTNAIISSGLLAGITNQITISGWMNCIGTTTNYLFTDNVASASNRISISIVRTDNTYYIDFGDIGGEGRLTGTGLSSWKNRWVHVCIINNGTSLYLYIDGVLYDSKLNNSTVSNLVDGNIGGAAPSSPITVGNIKDVRIYNTALIQQEITDIYNYEKNFRPIDIDDGLIAYYPLAKNSLDNYYNEYDGTDTAMTYDGLSAVFNGTTSHSRIGAGIENFKTQVHSMSAWVKINALAVGNQYIIDNNIRHAGAGATNNSGSAIVIGGDGFIRAAYTMVNAETTEDTNGNLGTNYGANAISSSIAMLNTWYHVVMVMEDNMATLYIDGVGDCSVTSVQSIHYGTTDDNYCIGANARDISETEYINGYISNVRHYNKAISPEQVAVIYNTEKVDFVTEIPNIASLTNTRQYDDIIIDGRTIETKVELKSIDDKCTEVSADLWKKP